MKSRVHTKYKLLLLYAFVLLCSCRDSGQLDVDVDRETWIGRLGERMMDWVLAARGCGDASATLNRLAKGGRVCVGDVHTTMFLCLVQRTYVTY